MTVASIALFALAGGGAGVLAGLFGIGGGAVLVPILYLLLDTRMEGEGLTVMAHATSLAVIVPTAVSALLRYHASSLVPWRVVAVMGSGAALGALATTRLVPQLPETGLRAAFALFLAVVGLRMLRRDGSPPRPGVGAPPHAPDPRAAPRPDEGRGESGAPESDHESRPRTFSLALGGGAVGVLSAALGVGGGTLAIPILLFGVRMDIRRVAAASMGVVALAAVAGTAGYLLATPSDLPVGAVGFVYVPAALGLIPGAVVGARFGASLNTRTSPGRLRLLFALLLLGVSARIFWMLLAP